MRFPAPDIGVTFEHDSNTFRVSGWLKAMLDQAEISVETIADKAAEDRGISPSVIDLLLTSTQQRVGPDKKRLVWCTREEAEYIEGAGVCGVIVRVGDVKITGRVNWPAHVIEDYRKQALRLVGEPIW